MNNFQLITELLKYTMPFLAQQAEDLDDINVSVDMKRRMVATREDPARINIKVFRIVKIHASFLDDERWCISISQSQMK